MGQNKIDLTKDTTYDLTIYATKEELETVKGMIEVSARIVETKGLQVSGSSSNNNVTYTVAECDYIILTGKAMNQFILLNRSVIRVEVHMFLR